MDAPPLPPSSHDVQSNLPSVVANASAVSTSLPSALMPSDPVAAVAWGTTTGRKSAERSGLESLSKPDHWLASSHLMRSFRFVGQAFRVAQVSSVLGLAQPGSTVPLHWARSQNWKSWGAIADIQVTLVNVSAQQAKAENSPWAAPLIEPCLPAAKRDLQSEDLRYRISFKHKTLGYVADKDRAFLLAQQLQRLIRQADFEADAIAPTRSLTQATEDANDFLVTAGDQPLFSIDEAMAEDIGYSKEWAAVAWANNLRIALETEPLSVGDAQMTLQNLQPSTLELSGEASWYGPYFHGRPTANGETYDQNELSVAHKSLPFGTQLKVRNLTNDKTVVVRVNDRGPYVDNRSLDLSKAAAECLGSDQTGVIPYEAVILKETRRR